MSKIIAFDIGYASIGWCVLHSESDHNPKFLGTGVVTFPSDDCLASERRALRRTRRHIRSTRRRIERLKLWLEHRGVLNREILDRPGHPAPFLLAAAALAGHKTLTAFELWTVLRWYAHNRGYDGNSRWSRGEDEDSEDTEKVGTARALMAEHNTKSMAATVCACLDLDPAQHKRTISTHLPYKTLNAAYPRGIVEDEVRKILDLHVDKITGLDAETADAIFTKDERTNRFRRPKSRDETFNQIGIRLPRRYHGGLLFGQLVPRFDNRIIKRCPITWAEQYDDAIAHGKSEPEARKTADKFAKVPAARSGEFLRYRFARVLANIQADGRPLDAETREHLWELAQKRGSLTSKTVEKEIKTRLGDVITNVDAYFKIHPDAEKQLVLDPARDTARKAEGTSSRFSPIWSEIPSETKDWALHQWRRNRSVSLTDLIDHANMRPADFPNLQKSFEKANKPKRGKAPFAQLDDYLRQTSARPDFPSGRAPYARPILEQVVDEVRRGENPTQTKGDDSRRKEADGVLYPTLDPTSRVRRLQAERPLPELTNNHLVRHRLFILGRLLDDIAAEFLTDRSESVHAVVEVARELKEFSGMSAKEVKAELNNRLKDFKDAVDHLEKNAPTLERNGSIIRKCRIAMDLGWHCPFTGDHYDVCDLPKLEREHIIPYSTRSTNALNALVLTWPEVNRMKGQRTARKFIEEEGGKGIVGKPNLSLKTLRAYDTAVDNLDTSGHEDDRRRKRARKALLETSEFDEKESGFTEGALTQSSQLMKLAMASIRKQLISLGYRDEDGNLNGAVIDPVPGPVTAEIRKSWKLTGTLAQACPEVIDSNGSVIPKREIRGLTHLHHALDAATLGLAAHYFPLRRHGQDQKGKIWQALLKRRRNREEKDFLLSLSRPSIFQSYQRTRRDREGNEYQETDVRLRDLDAPIKESLSSSLAESRVMQHVPADRSGTRAELTTWGIAEKNDKETVIVQRVARTNLKLDDSTADRRFQDQPIKKPTKDLLKRVGDHLSPEQRRLVERGILKLEAERSEKLLGTHPTNGDGKLEAIDGAVVISDNYGLALDPEPTVIPFHAVQQQIDELQRANGGKPVRMLRNGMLIRLEKSPGRSRQDYSGVWRISSIKNNKGRFLLDIVRPAYVTPRNGVEWAGMNKTVQPLLDCGMEILPKNYTAFPCGKKEERP